MAFEGCRMVLRYNLCFVQAFELLAQVLLNEDIARTSTDFFMIQPVVICTSIPSGKFESTSHVNKTSNNLKDYHQTVDPRKIWKIIDEFNRTRDNKPTNITFKEYLQEFEPSRVWDKIEKRNKKLGLNRTVKDEFDAVYAGIDDADDLLKLKVQNGNPTIEVHKDGRRWHPPYAPIRGPYWDQYNLRPRLVELMKQGVYQARYKMTIMQTLRNKYRKNSVYKMGYLISKTDIACKTLASVAYKLHRDCSNARQFVARWLPLIDLLAGDERLLTLWFDVDILVDLITKNDENCRRMLKEVMTNRKHAWKFYD